MLTQVMLLIVTGATLKLFEKFKPLEIGVQAGHA